MFFFFLIVFRFGVFGIFGFGFLVVLREGGCFFLVVLPLGARIDNDIVEKAYLNCRKRNRRIYMVRQTRPMSCAFLASTVVFKDDTDLRIWHRGTIIDTCS